MRKTLVLDISAILYRSYYASMKDNHDEITTAGLAMHQSLQILNKYYKLYLPNKIIMTFDRPNSWRKIYTKSDMCLSGKIYKGNRRKNQTEKQKEMFKRFIEHLQDFETLMREHTSIVCLAMNGAEADDLVAIYTQEHHNDEEIIVISTDKDFIQLLRYPTVKLINPINGEARDLSEWENDVDYFLMFKMIRGDAGDNVGSSLPRIRATKILEAYNDPIAMVNMMETKWTDQNKTEFTVKDLYEENELLMDLLKQPEQFRQKAKDLIKSEVENSGKYSYFHFLKFCGKFELKKVAQQADNFTEMLSR